MATVLTPSELSGFVARQGFGIELPSGYYVLRGEGQKIPYGDAVYVNDPVLGKVMIFFKTTGEVIFAKDVTEPTGKAVVDGFSFWGTFWNGVWNDVKNLPQSLGNTVGEIGSGIGVAAGKITGQTTVAALKPLLPFVITAAAVVIVIALAFPGRVRKLI